MPTKRSPWLLPLLMLGVVGTGAFIGVANAPGEWYRELAKPGFNPPNWVFGPVWTVLYGMIAVAGWRVWAVSRDGLMRGLWVIQMGLNFLWSPLFFGFQRIGWALADILVLLAVIALFVFFGWRRDRPAAILFLPYLVWVGFAAVLNAAIFALNRG